MKYILSIIFVLMSLSLFGCGAGEMSEQEAEAVGNNMNRPLTQEEQAQMGQQGGAPEAPIKGN